jgi:hypothetical protein
MPNGTNIKTEELALSRLECQWVSENLWFLSLIFCPDNFERILARVAHYHEIDQSRVKEQKERARLKQLCKRRKKRADRNPRN